jgi:hypothetical protein
MRKMRDGIEENVTRSSKVRDTMALALRQSETEDLKVSKMPKEKKVRNDGFFLNFRGLTKEKVTSGVVIATSSKFRIRNVTAAADVCEIEAP